MNYFCVVLVGLLCINVICVVVYIQLGLCLVCFLCGYLDVCIELVQDDGLVDIVVSGFDVGVWLYEFVFEDMVVVLFGLLLCGLIVGVFVYLQDCLMLQYLCDLVNYECVCFCFVSGYLYKWQFDCDGQVLEIDVLGWFMFGDQYMVLQVVLDGLGLVYVLEDVVWLYLDDGWLVVVLEDWSELFFGFVLYYLCQWQMFLVLCVFVDMLCELV